MSPHPERIDPDTWTDEFYFLNQPAQADIQTDVFFDYQNNLKAYPIWQKWLRDHKPPMLVIWGRYDPSFTIAGLKHIVRKCRMLRSILSMQGILCWMSKLQK